MNTYRSLIWTNLTTIFGDEGVLGAGLINATKRILAGACLLGNLLRTTRDEVAADDAKIAHKLANFGIGEDEGEKRAKMLNGLLTVRLDLAPIDGEDLVGVLLGLVETDVTGVPDEVLEDLIGVLLADEGTEGIDDVARVGDELLALRGERVGVGEEAVIYV